MKIAVVRNQIATWEYGRRCGDYKDAEMGVWLRVDQSETTQRDESNVFRVRRLRYKSEISVGMAFELPAGPEREFFRHRSRSRRERRGPDGHVVSGGPSDSLQVMTSLPPTSGRLCADRSEEDISERRERNKLAQRRYRRNQKNELLLMRHKVVKYYERETELVKQLHRVSQEKNAVLAEAEVQRRQASDRQSVLVLTLCCADRRTGR